MPQKLTADEISRVDALCKHMPMSCLYCRASMPHLSDLCLLAGRITELQDRRRHECRKCGSNNIEFRHTYAGETHVGPMEAGRRSSEFVRDGVTMSGFTTLRECLLLTCGNCFFRWETETNDAER